MNDPHPPDFLSSTLSTISEFSSTTQPYVTLTFAQSLDAKIAGAGGQQLILSGKESMIMTHWMRTMHDAILIGIGTALNDDPQLNTRHLPPLPGGEVHQLPQPVVLDTHLRLSPTCKLLKNYATGVGKQPWLICVSNDSDAGWRERKSTLETAGVRVLALDSEDVTVSGLIPVSVLLDTLHTEGIKSLMVEGGARVIESFLAFPKVINTIIITVAPTFVGSKGVGYVGADQVPTMKHLKTEPFGQDFVVALTTKD